MNEHDHDADRNRDHNLGTNDNGARGDKGVVPASAGSAALTSLADLQTMLNNVELSSLTTRSGKPMMLFKSRENGTWMFGRTRTVPEVDSLWAFNPTTFQWGFICFGNDNKVVDERLVSVAKPKPDRTALPDTGFPWQEERGVDLKCISGVDAGAEVTLKINTDGGLKAVDGLIETVRDRLNGGQHDGKIVPISHLGRDSYPHREHGRIWYPVIDVVDWMLFDGPAPRPAPPPPPPPPPHGVGTTAAALEQPRRRRVA
jgi:hypothetical protein